jgi:hypothetical protein
MMLLLGLKPGLDGSPGRQASSEAAKQANGGDRAGMAAGLSWHAAREGAHGREWALVDANGPVGRPV